MVSSMHPLNVLHFFGKGIMVCLDFWREPITVNKYFITILRSTVQSLTPRSMQQWSFCSYSYHIFLSHSASLISNRTRLPSLTVPKKSTNASSSSMILSFLTPK